MPGSQARPADIFLPSWSLGRPAALDVHVISPLQVLTVADAAFTPGHALQVGVQRKLASNLSACCSSGTDFVPLVAETLGGLAEDTISTITSISRAIADRSSSPDPAATSRHLFGRLAITLWRGNAALCYTVQQPFPLPRRCNLIFRLIVCIDFNFYCYVFCIHLPVLLRILFL